MNPMLNWLLLSTVVIFIDQYTKHLVIEKMALYETVELAPFFQFTYLRNEGAAFSFLAGAGGWQRWFFIALAVVASAGICYWLTRLKPSQHFEAAAWALVLGGALGNLIDRVRYGYVVDFLDVFYKNWHWPAFNIADSAITVGVAMLILDSLRNRETVES